MHDKNYLAISKWSECISVVLCTMNPKNPLSVKTKSYRDRESFQKYCLKMKRGW